MNILTRNPFVPDTPNLSCIMSSEPSLVVRDATLTIQQIAARYTRGNLDGVNVHPIQYSTELTPLQRKGVELCDFTALKEYVAEQINDGNKRLQDLQNQLADIERQGSLKPDGDNTAGDKE